MKNSNNVDIQKAVDFIKSIYIYIYTVIYIFVELKMYVQKGLKTMHDGLKIFPYYMLFFNKVNLYYTNFLSNSVSKNCSIDKEMDDISDIIKKLD